MFRLHELFVEFRRADVAADALELVDRRQNRGQIALLPGASDGGVGLVEFVPEIEEQADVQGHVAHDALDALPHREAGQFQRLGQDAPFLGKGRRGFRRTGRGGFAHGHCVAVQGGLKGRDVERLAGDRGKAPGEQGGFLLLRGNGGAGDDGQGFVPAVVPKDVRQGGAVHDRHFHVRKDNRVRAGTDEVQGLQPVFGGLDGGPEGGQDFGGDFQIDALVVDEQGARRVSGLRHGKSSGGVQRRGEGSSRRTHFDRVARRV